MEVPRLGVVLELQLPAYTTATATQDPSLICDLHCSSWQCWILDLLSEARGPTHNPINTSWAHYAEPQQALPQEYVLKAEEL